MEYKRCSACKEAKHRLEFSIDRSRASGLANSCRPCRKIIKLKYRQKNKEKLRVAAKRYRESNKGKLSEYNREYRAEENKTEILLSCFQVGKVWK